MTSLIWLALTGLGLGLILVMRLLQGRALARPRPRLSAGAPGVTILKPLCGVDENLAQNLRSFFRLDYPRCQIVLGAADGDDPALDIARAIAAEHPHVDATVVVTGPHAIGLNPKVNNLHGLQQHAHHEILVISDSNVAVQPDYLDDLIAHLEQPGVGLVSSLIRAHVGRGLGGAMESLQLNTYVMGGVSASACVMPTGCVVGKSMALRSEDLRHIGGLPRLAEHLAEDQVCGEEVARLGRRTVLSGQVVDNVLGRVRVLDFARRHVRWARIRWCICPAGYLGELLLNPIAIATSGWLFTGEPLLAAAAAGTALMKTVSDASAEIVLLGVRRSLWHYPLLVPLKDLLLAVLWPLPLVHRTVTWRGNRLIVGRRTRLSPATPLPSAPPTPGSGLPTSLPTGSLST